MRWLFAVMAGSLASACGSTPSDQDIGSTSPESDAPEPTPGSTTAEPSPADTGDDIIVEPDSAPTEYAARGAISIEIAPGCSVPGGFYDFPPGPEHPVDAETKAASWSTGDVAPDDTSVSATCVWQPTNPPKAIVAFDHGVFGNETSVGLNIVIDPDAPEVDVLVSLQTPEVPGGLGTSEASSCVATFIELDEDAMSFWGSFTCDALTALAGGDTCAVTRGYFYFDNCRVFAPR